MKKKMQSKANGFEDFRPLPQSLAIDIVFAHGEFVLAAEKKNNPTLRCSVGALSTKRLAPAKP
jgi:hypothetical protein